MQSVAVQLEERDYVAAARAAAQPGRGTLLTLAIASVLVIVGANVAFTLGYVREAIVGGFVWFFALAGAWVGHVVTIVPKAKRVFAQQRALQRPHQISWDNVGLTITGDEGQSTTRWTDVHKVRELDDQFLLFLSDAVFLMIPKRSFPDEALRRAFKSAILTSVPSTRHLR